jgi:hypothetical protein
MFEILHLLGMFVVSLFKSRSRLEAENLFLRHKRMRHCGELSNGLAASSPYPFWPGYIINMSGHDFRKGQGHDQRPARVVARITGIVL